MGKKAVAAGHICIDITPVFPDQGKKAGSLSEAVRPGSLVHVEAPDVHTGGSAANTGVGMKVLGADVRVVGKVGDDAFASMVRSILDEYGAGSDLITAPGETTSYSIVLALPGIDRSFLHCPGANDSFDGTEIGEEVLSDAALFHFGYPPLMRRMYEEDGRCLAEMFARIHGMGIATSLDMAAIDPNSAAGRADWRRILERTLPHVDFFVPSFEELCRMLDPERYERLAAAAGEREITTVLDPEKDAEPLADICLSMGAGAVLVKCGVPGLFLKTANMDRCGKRLELDTARWSGFRTFEKSFFVEHVVSGTGAGDVSIAAFLAGILEGGGPEEAVREAAAAGALSCMSVDAVSGLRPLGEIREMIASGKLRK